MQSSYIVTWRWWRRRGHVVMYQVAASRWSLANVQHRRMIKIEAFVIRRRRMWRSYRARAASCCAVSSVDAYDDVTDLMPRLLPCRSCGRRRRQKATVTGCAGDRFRRRRRGHKTIAAAVGLMMVVMMAINRTWSRQQGSSLIAIAMNYGWLDVTDVICRWSYSIVATFDTMAIKLQN